MKIDLEKYIRNHRADLDDVEDINVDEMWGEFHERTRPKKKLKFGFYLAAAVGIILIGVFTVVNKHSNLNQDEIIHEKLVEADPRLAEEQVSLVKMISDQGELIGQMGIDQEEFPELFQELKVLDSLQMEAMNDLENYRDRKNLWKTLLRNYKSKARVLELMIYEFDKKENELNYESSKQI